MATYDMADLLDRCKRLAKRPSNDTETADTDAQLYWLGQFQLHFPRINWNVWEKMATSDSGLTYTFAGTPLGPVEIFPNQRASYSLRAASPIDQTADFTWEGEDTIRMTGNKARTFADGPYARYVERPPDIALGVDPVLLPEEARLLIVYSAVAAWAHEGAMRDPSYFEDLIDGLWLGKRPGDYGLLGMLKKRFASSSDGVGLVWYKSPDLSTLPVATS